MLEPLQSNVLLWGWGRGKETDIHETPLVHHLLYTHCHLLLTARLDAACVLPVCTPAGGRMAKKVG